MTRFTRSLLSAAVLSVAVSGAFAQTRVDRSGATDANQRVGSNGRNSVSSRQNPWEISNRIVYGNTTGGKQFRGNATGDPQAFRGATGSSNFDRFVRSSSSVTTGGDATYNASQTRAYYGDSRAVAPPIGTSTNVSSTGQYSPPVPNNWTTFDPRQTSVSDGTTPAAGSALGAPGGEANLQGSLGTATASPYGFGVYSKMPGNDLSDYTQLNTTTNDLTPNQIKQVQSDEPQSRLPGQTPITGAPNSNQVDAQPQQNNAPGNPVNNAGVSPNGTPANGTTNTPAGGAVDPSAIDNSVNPQNGPQLGTVSRMTPRYDAKANLPDKAGTAAAAAAEANTIKRPGLANEEASRDFTKQFKAAQDAKGKTDDQPKPGDPKKPGDGATPAGTTPGSTPVTPSGPPPKVESFVGAATTKGMTDLLTKAEGQMKAGQFSSAIDTYGEAEAKSPRVGMVQLGRANAELGGAFYRRAEQSLRRAFTTDKNLLKSQYDLRAFLGDDRLATITKDLKDLLQNKDTDAGAAALLAYVYYNTGNETYAAALLDLADKRANGRDTLITAMKSGWTFTAPETK